MSYLIEEKMKELEEDIRQLPHNSRIELDPKSGMEAVLKPEVLAKSMEKEGEAISGRDPD